MEHINELGLPLLIATILWPKEKFPQPHYGPQIFPLSSSKLLTSCLVLLISVEFFIFYVEAGGGTYKRDSDKQVSSTLRCLYIYVWND